MRWKLATVADGTNPVKGDLALDATGDVSWFSASEADLETIQRLQTRFGLFQGEWFADKRVGMPWYQRILGRKDVSEEAKRAIFSRIVRTCPGVASLESLTLTDTTNPREKQVNFTGRLVSGFKLDSAKLAPFIVKV